MRTLPTVVLAVAGLCAGLSPAHAASPTAPATQATKASTCALPDLVCKASAPGGAPQTNVGCSATCATDQGKAVCTAGKCEAGQFTKMNTCQCTK